MKRASQPKISMPNPELKIQCSNSHCSASNALESRFCKRCKTPVVKRYLWSIKPVSIPKESEALADTVEANSFNGIISDRYFALTDRIFLDTKPGLLPQIPDELPTEIVNYLKLSSYSPHIPQVYGQIDGTDHWLLDYGTIPTKPSGKLIYPQLIPDIKFLWSEAPPQKQLNWLLQIAKLWKPLQSKGLASTLLKPSLLRVNSSFLQILQLESDPNSKPKLRELGAVWSELSKTASPKIQEILTQIGSRLEDGTIENIKQVIILLNRALEIFSQDQEYSYQVFARSDSGPSRDNNEDAAYPASDIPTTISSDCKSLAIVCDGVGGHDGGEIASSETIKFLQSRIDDLHFDKNPSNPDNILKQLTDYINEANDAINERNDSEQRQERQRMGTTLVMTLARNHAMYFTHVGDSRIYWITQTGCHQITIDDDLASREVRLGYAVYRDALQYPSAGALIQALGMRDSTALHPNAKHLIVDDNCIFLLCSDGLSDFDRIEQYWRSLILPVLSGKGDITKAVHRLVKLGNERNGHDNVTVALVHCKVKSKSDSSDVPIPWSSIESALEESLMWSDVNVIDDILPNTQCFTETPKVILDNPEVSQKPKLLQWKLIILGLIVSVGVGLLLYFLPRIINKKNRQDSSSILEQRLDLASSLVQTFGVNR